ncbi:MAG TPA: SDR family oxidoreductase [Gemmataceae bacterium]|jgi:thioester reductase-like protein
MSATQGIFLTGATGLLGRYLLRDLLASGRPVGVLIRDSSSASATERLAELQSFCEESLRRSLPRPVLLQGDLRRPGLGLGAGERHWLTRNARAVIHSAAYVSYQPTLDGEPWQTNVLSTRGLLELCQSLGITQIHHLSTAFVCGDRRGLVREDELDCGGGSKNAYERSKFAAEELARQFPGIRATIYRPSVIVGDSGTGYTCTYHHFYRFLELAVRLSSRPQRVSLRLPLTGTETQNIVPVDWVSRALLALVDRPRWHGRTYHLTAWESVRLDEIKNILSELLPLEGVEWVGPAGLPDPTPLEQLVLEQFQDYWGYLYSNLEFDCRNTRQTLPDLPPPRFDRELVARLLKFAQADNWGRQRGRASPSLPPAGGRPSECAHYLECVLPEKVQHSPLARALPHDFRFALDIRGEDAGQWSFRCGGEEILSVQRGLDAVHEVIYRIHSETFVRLIRGQESAQKAFLDGKIEIEGDMEKALLLAMFIEQFLAESSEPAATTMPHA